MIVPKQALCTKNVVRIGYPVAADSCGGLNSVVFEDQAVAVVSALGQAIRAKREAMHLSQDEFAAALGLKGGSIWNLENGVTQTFKKPEQLRLLREKFGIDAAAIEGGSKSSTELYPSRSATVVAEYESVSAARVDYRGDGEAGQRTAVVPAGSARRFVVRVDGECMIGVLPNGCRVVCDYGKWEDEKFVSGRVYWVRFTSGEMTLKRVLVDGVDLIFTCDNPAFGSFRRPAAEVAAAALVVQKIEEIR